MPIAPFVSIEQARIALRPAPESLITHIINKAVDNGRVRKSATGLALSEHDPVTLMTSDQHALYQAAETRLLDMALHPAALFDHPTQDEQDIIALLIFQGRAVSLYNHSLKQSLLLHGDAIEAARVRLNSAFSNAARFTTSEARMVLETNRKTIVPLLEHFDQLGLTTRTGDVRAFAISKRD